MSLKSLERAAGEARRLATEMRQPPASPNAYQVMFAKLRSWSNSHFLGGNLPVGDAVDVEDSLLVGHLNALIGRVYRTGSITEDNVAELAEQLEEMAPLLESGSARVGPPAVTQPVQDTQERVGKWRILRPLGAGGQGRVDLVVNDEESTHGAMKRLAGGRGMTEKGAERFRRETSAMRDIRHPFVARVLDSSPAPNAYLVTPYAELGTLHDVRDAFRGDVWRTLRVCRSVALGLGAMHAKKMVHRDVKPKNILMVDLDHPLVADLGITHFEEMDELTSLGSHPHAKMFGPPEAMYKVEPTPAFDVYSLGAMLRSVLTGEEMDRPYRAVKRLSPVSQVLGAPGLIALDALLLRMMAEETGDRIGDMSHVVKSVDELLAGVRIGQTHRCQNCGIGITSSRGSLHLGRDAILETTSDAGAQPIQIPFANLRTEVESCGRCGALTLRSANHTL